MRYFLLSLLVGLVLIPTWANADNCFVRLYNHTGDEVKVTYKNTIDIQSGRVDSLAPNQEGAMVWFKDWTGGMSQDALVILTNTRTKAQCLYHIFPTLSSSGDTGVIYYQFHMLSYSHGTKCAPSEMSVHPGSGFNLDIQ